MRIKDGTPYYIYEHTKQWPSMNKCIKKVVVKREKIAQPKHFL